MKKIFIFLFALALGVGISQAFASGMQPPGHDEVITVSTVTTSNEMPAPAIMKVVNQEMAATYEFNYKQVGLPEVQSGSSGGISALCIINREMTLKPLNWTQTADQYRANSDLSGCTKTKINNTPVFAITCSYRFLLI